ncbi:MAG TPA: hypothetical protein VE987_07305, partial [Polyangiaceae bacterium]|nr:hypothetical protein [Polyangiaceae bacterium]
EIAAPRAVGWIHKQVKLRRQRLDRLYLVELSVAPPSTTVKLRRTPDPAGAGFDLAYSSDPSRVEIARVLQGGAVPDPPYVAGAQDVANLQRLRERLVALATELAANRRSLIAASLDDTPLLQLEPPRLVADRLLSTIGPMVQELASRSLAPGELVIKRLVGGNVREEVFVSKAELRKKLELLPAELRRAFDAFQLADRVERSPEQGLDGAGRAEAGAPPPPVEPAGPHRRPPARAVTPPSPPPRDRRPEPRGAGGTGRWPALPLTVAADEEAAIATPADGRPTVPGARPVSPPGRSQGARLGARRDPGAGAP